MNTPDPDLTGAGLSSTGTTADEFEPGEPGPGTAYGAPGGVGTEAKETTQGEKASDGEKATDGEDDST